MQLRPSRIKRWSRSGEVGAVVIGGDYQGLGIARSLGRHGIPVIVMDDELSITRCSKYVVGHVTAPDLRQPDSTMESLIELGRSLHPRGWVLFPTREETVATLAVNREALGEYFRVPTPPMKSVRAAWDKRETYRIAAELGIPVPRCWFPSSMEDLSGIDLSSPVVVKPAIKEHFFYATGAKAWRADDATQLREAYQRACAVVESSEIIIQELVPGGGARQLSYCALFKDGRTIARMTAVRLRQHPSDFGRASTFVRTESLDELEGPSTRFLRAIEYYGLVELEYKRDPRDDVPKLLDVNARTWGYHSLGVAAGVDFPYLLFRDQLSLPVDAAPARDGVSWIRAATDLPNATRDMWRRDLRVADYLRTLRGIDTEAVFSRSDPWPGIAEIGLLPYLAVRRGL